LWQCAYAELYFTDIFWPDFGEEELYEAILNFQGRERRYGKISEQIEFEQ
jgi:undecaprenyl diphosphate synthase